MRSFVALLGVALVVNAMGFAGSAPRRYSPGVLIPQEPSQVELKGEKPFLVGDYVVTPLADYSLSGRIVARNSYWFGRESDLSPLDLGIAWGEMSDQQVLDKFRFALSMRYLRWSADSLDLPPAEIESHVSNNHLIPATKAIERQLSSLSLSDLVELHGKLVRVDAADGWHWQSSLTRTDSGEGACEVFYVQSVRKIERRESDRHHSSAA